MAFLFKPFLVVSSVALLASCGGSDRPAGDEYFDSVNPNAKQVTNAGLETSQRLLAEARARANLPATPADSTEELRALEGTVGPTPDAAETVASGTATASTEASSAPLAVADNPEISRSQDFEVASAQDTIESDAAKLQRLSQQYEVVEAGELPTRTASVNLAAYALSQKQRIGEATYARRRGTSGCGKYKGKADLAQRVFLEQGGPTRDRRGLDRDGDGFACDWNPDKYRVLAIPSTTSAPAEPAQDAVQDPLIADIEAALN